MAVPLKTFIQEIAGKKAPGPSTSFTVFHLYYALELLSEKPLGRNKLAKELGVGDGAVRTIISRLRDAELIDSHKEGCCLTQKGLSTWQQFQDFFPKRVEIPRTELSTAEYNFAFLVKNAGDKVKSGIDQRDAAIIVGALQALVTVFRKGN